MLNSILRFTGFAGCLIFLAGCGNALLEDQDIEGRGTLKFNAATDLLAFPDAANPDLSELKNVPNGNYKLQSFKTYVVDTKQNYRATFERSLRTLGAIGAQDGISVKTDWRDQESFLNEFKLQISLNLPGTIFANGSGFEFKDRRYYWHTAGPSGNWRWRTSGKESPAGARFIDLFTNSPTASGKIAEKADLVYGNSRIRARGAFQVTADKLIFFLELYPGTDEYCVVRLEYVRA